LPASGAFSFTYTFTLTTTGLVSPGVIITSTLESRLPTPTEFALYDGSTLIEEAPLTITGSDHSWTASVTLPTVKELAGDDYKVVLSGTSHGNMSIGGTVATSPVPEPSTWAMMALGFLGLGYAAFRRNARFRSVVEAI